MGHNQPRTGEGENNSPNLAMEGLQIPAVTMTDALGITT